MRILVLNGPNLDRLGRREPEVYGSETLADLESTLATKGIELGAVIDARQSNHEGDLIDWINGSDHDGLVINPGALSHTSRALADSIRSISEPTVEVHISNVRDREPWRAVSVVSPACVHSIYGRGTRGYLDAIRHLVNRAAYPSEEVRYGPHRDNVGDLRRGKEGLVVLVHGGFWRHEWARDTMESLAVDLSGRGVNTWNIEYRRLGDGGGWPGSAHDVLTAFDFVPQLDLDPSAVSVVGHSAGAHLATWATGRTSIEIGRLVSLAPVVDLPLHSGSGLFGAAEAGRLLASGAPARVYPRVPTTSVHGMSDDLVPAEHSRSLQDGELVEVISPDAGHFDLLDPGRAPWEVAVQRIVP